MAAHGPKQSGGLQLTLLTTSPDYHNDERVQSGAFVVVF
jgi:hypothetical protein